MHKFCMRIRIHHTMHDVNLYDKRLKVSFAGLKKGPCSTRGAYSYSEMNLYIFCFLCNIPV